MQENKQFVVYVATNIINGHRYIGFTSTSLQKRKNSHFLCARKNKNCPKFHNALYKYGEEAFNWRIIAIFNTASEAFAEEIRLIAEFNPEYNISKGGEGRLGVPAHNRKSVTCLEDGKMFMSATHAAKFYKLNKANILNVCHGKYRAIKDLHFIFGDKLYSEDERKQLILKIERTAAKKRKKVDINKNNNGIKNGKNILGKIASGAIKRSKKVLCLTDGKSHPSASEAARYYNISTSNITAVCLKRKNRNTAGGLKFIYENT